MQTSSGRRASRRWDRRGLSETTVKSALLPTSSTGALRRLGTGTRALLLSCLYVVAYPAFTFAAREPQSAPLASKAGRRILSPRRALTTGAGLPTLGEEFTEILQATPGPDGTAASVSPMGRAMLVALEALGPYLAERLDAAARAQSDGGGSGSEESLHTARSGAPSEVERPSSRASDPGDSADRSGEIHAAPTATARDAAGASEPAPWPDKWASPGAAALWLRDVARDAAQWALAALEHRYRVAWSRAVPALRAVWAYVPHLRALASQALRAHLALFYLRGAYLSLAKRLTRVQYVFFGRLLDQLPSYQLLGEVGTRVSAAVRRRCVAGLVSKTTSFATRVPQGGSC